MGDLLNSDSTLVLRQCIDSAFSTMAKEDEVEGSARLTLASLLRFQNVSDDKPTPNSVTPLKEAVVRTGAYYFGPLFVLNKGTSIPTTKILQELVYRGFYTDCLKYMNNAQLNLFFITLKCMGLVSDKHLIGYVKYGV